MLELSVLLFTFLLLWFFIDMIDRHAPRRDVRVNNNRKLVEKYSHKKAKRKKK